MVVALVAVCDERSVMVVFSGDGVDGLSSGIWSHMRMMALVILFNDDADGDSFHNDNDAMMALTVKKKKQKKKQVISQDQRVYWDTFS